VYESNKMRNASGEERNELSFKYCGRSNGGWWGDEFNVMPSNSGMGYMGEFREIMEGGWILQIMDLDIH